MKSRTLEKIPRARLYSALMDEDVAELRIELDFVFSDCFQAVEEQFVVAHPVDAGHGVSPQAVAPAEFDFQVFVARLAGKRNARKDRLDLIAAIAPDSRPDDKACLWKFVREVSQVFPNQWLGNIRFGHIATRLI